MEVLRKDLDEVRGPDIRRRVIEALPALFDLAPQSLLAIIRLLQLQPDDDIYVALATVETCGDIQIRARFLLEQKEHPLPANLGESTRHALPEIASIQRHILTNWEGRERESLQFSMALHNLLPVPDTLLISLQEGLQSQEKLIQLVAVRYLERVLPAKPEEAFKLYLSLPGIALHKNVRRTVAKALPALLQCLKETSLSTRALARSVLLMLAEDSDIPIRRAVADHAMQMFSIERAVSYLATYCRKLKKIYIDFIAGLPGESSQDEAMSQQLMERLTRISSKVCVHSHTFMPLPGTPLQYMPPGSVGKTTRATFEYLSKRGQEWGDWKEQEEIAHAITQLRQTLKQKL